MKSTSRVLPRETLAQLAQKTEQDVAHAVTYFFYSLLYVRGAVWRPGMSPGQPSVGLWQSGSAHQAGRPCLIPSMLELGRAWTRANSDLSVPFAIDNHYYSLWHTFSLTVIPRTELQKLSIFSVCIKNSVSGHKNAWKDVRSSENVGKHVMSNSARLCVLSAIHKWISFLIYLNDIVHYERVVDMSICLSP